MYLRKSVNKKNRGGGKKSRGGGNENLTINLLWPKHNLLHSSDGVTKICDILVTSDFSFDEVNLKRLLTLVLMR